MYQRLLILALLLFTTELPSMLCAMGPGTDEKVEWKKDDLVHGYALLFGIAEKQKSLDLVLIVKTASKPASDLIKEITATYTELHDYLKPLEINRTLVAKASDGLPLAETSSRARIESIKTEQLLSRSGPFFELSLLTTQVEALTYSSALLSHIAEQDPSATNREKAREFRKKLDAHLKTLWQQIEKL